jgi:hypothetical protein
LDNTTAGNVGISHCFCGFDYRTVLTLAVLKVGNLLPHIVAPLDVGMML